MSLPPYLGQIVKLRPVQQRRLLLGLVAVLGGCGAVAFAVAPLAADTTLPLQTLVTEPLQPESDLPQQLQSWRAQSLALHRTELTRTGDTVATVLRRLGVPDAEAVLALGADDGLRAALRGDNRLVQALANDQGRLQQLVVLYPATDEAVAGTHYGRLTARFADGRWAVQASTHALAVDARVATARVRTHLRAAAAEAGIPAPVAVQLLELCAEQTESECALAPGASVAVQYEVLLAEGQPVPWNDGAGRVLAARFNEGGQTRQYTWFVGPDGRGGYLDGQGRGREPGFRVSPVEYTKITSGFATRIDPFLHRATAHQGVDYSAPIGTPVHVVATGTVEFAGRQSGYGNVVEVRHSAERSTLYAHLSRIDVVAGERLERGHVLGAVGVTGWATGPHLHFEYRVGGVHQDPQRAAASAAAVLLTPAARARFERAARVARAELDRAPAPVRTTFE